MDDAYGGKVRAKELDTHQGDIIFGLEDLADQAGKGSAKAEIESLVPRDIGLLLRLISEDVDKKHLPMWGYLTSIAAERSENPLHLPGRDYAGHELSRGLIVLEQADNYIGQGMKGGRVVVRSQAGNYLGQEMTGGGIVAGSCGDNAFKNMRGGWGVILAEAGNSLGLGNSGGRILIKGSCRDRTGWLMKGGKLKVLGDTGDYLGLLMSAGDITVRGRAGKRAGWRMKGGSIKANLYGPEAGEGAVGGRIL